MPTNKPSPVRHAIARSTGATTLAQKTEDGWKIDCLNHGSTVTVPSRGKAWVTGSHPQDWCKECGVIAAGKGEKITGDRLDAPKAPAKKAATKKAPTKPTTTTKKAVSKPTTAKGKVA